jgi:hypothetical protein
MTAARAGVYGVTVTLYQRQSDRVEVVHQPSGRTLFRPLQVLMEFPTCYWLPPDTDRDCPYSPSVTAAPK